MAELYALPPGADFARAFVAGLIARHGDLAPEAFARITIHANSQRMRRLIGEALKEAGIRLLPQLRLVSDLAQDLILADLPPQAPALRRRLQLNQLIRALIAREPGLAPASAVQSLTESLFALMEEMDGEGVEPAVLDRLDVSEHSEHWERSLRFLKILVPFFAHSAQRGAAARSRIAALRLAELWAAHPPAHPVIVAGSTASRGAILELMVAVARLPKGAVVLPGFDFDLPDRAWAAMDDALSAEDHPQYRFRRLMQRLDLTPRDIQPWRDLGHDNTPADPARNAVLSLALRPAPVTDQWLSDGASLTDLPQALAQVTLMEAPSPRAEAQGVALILRQAAAQGRTAALITPDRLLTRRVTAALDRWGLRPDDSAGRPLILSAPGRFLRHTAELFCEKLTAARLLVVLKHPMVMSGEGRGPHLLWTRDLELQLRRKGPVFPTSDDLRAFAVTRGALAAPWGACLAGFLEDLGALPDRLPLALWIEAHRHLSERLARGLAEAGSGALWQERPGETCLEVFDQMTAEAEHGGEISARDYADLFAALLAERAVQDQAPVHGTIEILGAREARECGAELVILAGLNEGSWPTLPGADPWLNRNLRKAAGLLLPERQIGLSAHDFQQAAAAPQVVFSRALRSDDSETVAARWLNRLTNLLAGLPAAGGDRALEEMRQRGAAWQRLAQAMDRPGPAERADPRLAPARRPRVIPPAQARPDRLSLTDIERLIRDPYAIYARRILGLRPLEALSAEPDFADRGIAIHAILDRFAKERPAAEDLPAARARLLDTASQVLGQDMPFPTARALWLARIESAADDFLTEDRRTGQTLGTEIEGGGPVAPSGLRLFGRLDRVDRLPDGGLVLIDYKTGQAPTPKQQKTFAKQLLVTAALVERGGFGLAPPLQVAEIRYVEIKAGGKVQSVALTDDLRATFWAGLVRLLSHYQSGDTGFTARRAPRLAAEVSDYDHLSRLGEWDTSEEPLAIVVGAADAQ